VQLFYFVLKTGRLTTPDLEGQCLADVNAARQHATAVAHQLMRNHEDDTSRWRILVCDDYLCPLFEVFFADVDGTRENLSPRMRAAVENVARLTAALHDTAASMRNTLSDMRNTLIQVDRALATMPGPRLAPPPNWSDIARA
jgi:hypothetical protein